MAVDIVDLRSFYVTPLGHVTRQIVGRALRSLWPDVSRQSVIGIGFATPYLPLFRGEAERVAALMPAAQGVVNWPADGLSATALVDPFAIPLPNASVDRILLVHMLEATLSPGDMLSEIWRVLSPGGRIIAIVPNRRGVWARSDTTPFGHGEPYSRTQLANVLRLALFSPESWMEALYLPPVDRRIVLRSARLWETVGRTLSLPFSGVHIVDATKQLYRPIPARAVRRGFMLGGPVPAPVASGRHGLPPDMRA